MAKGNGTVLNVVGLVLAIVSLFLVFYDTLPVTYPSFTTWTPSGLLLYFFTNISAWGTALMGIGTLFSNIATIFDALIVLFPLLFILAGICILVGIRGSGGPGFGAFVLLLYPLAYLVLEVIVPVATGGDFIAYISTMQVGAYIMLVAGILCAIGASRNGD